MQAGGANVWYFPDGWLPKQMESGGLESHEALMLLNTGTSPAEVKLDFYFEDKDPVADIPVVVEAERVKCLRMDCPEHVGGLQLPRMTQYALVVRSDVRIVAMFGRMDLTQPNLALYGCMGYCENR